MSDKKLEISYELFDLLITCTEIVLSKIGKVSWPEKVLKEIDEIIELLTKQEEEENQ